LVVNGTINQEQLYYFGPKNSMTLGKFYGGRTQISTGAGLGGFYSAFTSIGNKSPGGGRVWSWGIQMGFGIGGGIGMNYGYTGPSLQAIKNMINGN
jgi:hypothetical protein